MLLILLNAKSKSNPIDKYFGKKCFPFELPCHIYFWYVEEDVTLHYISISISRNGKKKVSRVPCHNWFDSILLYTFSSNPFFWFPNQISCWVSSAPLLLCSFAPFSCFSHSVENESRNFVFSFNWFSNPLFCLNGMPK